MTPGADGVPALPAGGASVAQTAFLATMSHEIRTPLNAIIGYASLLEMGLPGPLTAAQREQLGRIRTSSEHLLGIVNEVLDLATVESGRLVLRIAPALAVEAMQAAHALTAPLAAGRSLAVEDRCRSAGARYVGDASRVRQILVNLISNAVKFTRPGGTITLDCGVAEPGAEGAPSGDAARWVWLRVRDTGIGIAAAQLAAIFDPFVQAEGGHTRSQGGTGLGLTISRRLARLMQGELTVWSAPGEGSHFTLWLPAAAEAAGGGGSAVVEGRGALPPLGELAPLGRRLLRELDPIQRAIADRLVADPLVTTPPGLMPAQLADHQATLLADICVTLVALEELGGAPSPLLSDGTQIQRLVSERHGVQRARLGFSEAMLRREFAIVREEVGRVAARHAPEGGHEAFDEAVAVLLRLIEQAEQVSVRARLAEG